MSHQLTVIWATQHQLLESRGGLRPFPQGHGWNPRAVTHALVLQAEQDAQLLTQLHPVQGNPPAKLTPLFEFWTPVSLADWPVMP